MPKFAFTGRQASSKFPSIWLHGLGNGLVVFGIPWFVDIVVGCPVAQGFSGVPIVLILGRWVSALCRFQARFAIRFRRFLWRLVIFSMAQAIYGVTLTFDQGLPGSFAQPLMFLMARVAQGILRFILETFQSFRHIKSNRSFQGTPLRYAPELSR